MYSLTEKHQNGVSIAEVGNSNSGKDDTSIIVNYGEKYHNPALKFLSVLHPQGSFSLRLFKDAGKNHGETVTVADVNSYDWTEVRLQNKRSGKGVFVTVNQSDGEGVKACNITGIRAFFVDIDGCEPDEVALSKLPLPTMVVQSKNGKHLYWVLSETITMSADTYKAMQQGLAKMLGGDKSVCDLSRVMRLPGFYHNKDVDAPYLVDLTACHPEALYSLSDFDIVKTVDSPDSRKFEQILDGLVKVQTNRNNELNKAAFAARQLVDVLGYDFIYSQLLQVALKIGLQISESISTINSGLNADTSKSPDRLANNKFDKAVLTVEKFLNGRLRYNEIAQTYELDGAAVDLEALVTRVRRGVTADVSREDTTDAIIDLTPDNSYNPIKDYLTEIRGVKNDATLLPIAADYIFGTTDEMSRVYLMRWMVSAVARVMQPGCKADYVLILRGTQGRRKSQFFEVLAPLDSYQELGESDRGKDELMKLSSGWIILMNEFESISNRKDVNNLKEFITKRKDTYRKPYGRELKTYPRNMVFGGTANSDRFLIDETGSRRFWIIDCADRRVNLDWLKDNVLDLWAEAVYLYDKGERWHLSDDEEELAAICNQDYQVEDPWASVLAMGLEYSERVRGTQAYTTAQIIDAILNDKAGKVSSKRIAGLMRNQGYIPRQKRIGSARVDFWVKPDWNKDSIKFADTKIASELKIALEMGR